MEQCSHGITSDPFELEARPEAEIWNYQQNELGLNYRMTELQAALGLSQMDRLDAFVARRRLLAKRYDEKLSEQYVVTPAQIKEGMSSYHLYPIVLKTHGSPTSQKDIYKILVANGIGVNIHYIPVYLQPFYQRFGFAKGYCPNAENYFKHCISIPLYSGMTIKQQNKVCKDLQAAMEEIADNKQIKHIRG